MMRWLWIMMTMMMVKLNSIFQLLVLISATATSFGKYQPFAYGADVREYCEWESFNATCDADEVIVIGSARYGRMKLGKCVTKNYGHIGCGSDVTSYLDNRCSGRHGCEISVIKLHDKISCPTDFKSYLEASYDCIKVAVPSGDFCSNLTIATPSGLLASITVADRVSGLAPDCPWVIRMETHQRINISMFDFFAPPGEGAINYESGRSAPSSECIDYGTISELWGHHRSNTSICGGRFRQSIVYVSNSHVVEVRIRNSPTNPHYFLLKYEAFGCRPLVAPMGSWMVSSSSQAIVRCNETDESWRLICRGRTWDGYLGNCSAPAAADRNSIEEWTIDSNFPYGILLVIALGVLIGVAAGVLMLLAVLSYMRRRRLRRIRSRSHYIIDEGLMATQSIDGKTGGHADPRTPIFKPNSSTTVATADILLSRQGSWQRTRPLPDPSHIHPGHDGMAITPELPLLSPYSVEEQQQQQQLGGAEGIFGTFGGGYHEQCIDLLRCSGPSTRPISVGPGAPNLPGGGRESGPYYFKLDLSTGRHSDQQHGSAGSCFMCQAGTPRGPRPPLGLIDPSTGHVQP